MKTKDSAVRLLNKRAAVVGGVGVGGEKEAQASPSPDSGPFDHSWSLSAFFLQQLGPRKILGPTEECRLHHHEAVCDQDQEAGETVKVERDESAGNVTAVVAVLAPAAGAVSNKDKKKKEREKKRRQGQQMCWG